MVYAFATTTLYKDKEHWYYYSPKNDCFMSSGDASNGYLVKIAEHGKSTTTTIHGTCRCSDDIDGVSCEANNLTTTAKCNSYCTNKTNPATMAYSSCTIKKSA